MYSFEGDYRRRPQQNLAGASRRDEKAALLQHAQLERNKREQQRKRQNAALVIHAQTRSYLIRQSVKRNCRLEFDRARLQVQGRLQVTELIPYIRALLFFYNAKLDSDRLIWLLDHILSNKTEILNRYGNSDWLWRLRWILKLCLQFLLEIPFINKQISTALPLRVLESFITSDLTRKDQETYKNHLRDILKYLVQNSYFSNIKKLMEDNTPPLDDSTPSPPTLRLKCYFDLIKQPLVLSSDTKYDNDFALIVIKQFVNTILVPRMSDPIRLFLIPALVELKGFPYAEMICCINRLEIVPTRSLLYAVLTLEPASFNPSLSDTVLVNYVQVLASMTSTTLVAVPSEAPAGDAMIDDTDDMSISDAEAVLVDQGQVEIMMQCIKMLNEDDRVNRILGSLDRSDDPTVLQSLCQLCHNLLRTDKLASHKYKLLYMLAFKPEFVRRLWTALITTKQTSIFGGGSTPLVQIMSRGIAPTAEDSKNIASLIAVFCSLFSLLIATLHDSEFFTEDRENSMEEEDDSDETTAMPFTTSELVPLSDYLKGVCLGLVELAFPDCRPTIRNDYKSAVLGN